MVKKEKVSLSEQAYREIKRKILNLEFKPGQFLNELEICKMLDMGRTPVHQAVHRLMLDGLLDIIPRKGLLIRPDSMNEVLNLLEARSLVEPGMAALAAARATPEQISEMRALMEEEVQGTDREKRSRYMEIDHAFHDLIAQSANNNILADLLRPIHERSGRLWHLQLQTGNDMEKTNEEHRHIFEAVMRGDEDGAAKAMLAHLTSLRRRRLPSMN